MAKRIFKEEMNEKDAWNSMHGKTIKSIKRLKNVEYELDAIIPSSEPGTKLLTSIRLKIKKLKKELEFSMKDRWQCAECEKKFINKSALVRHLKTIHLKKHVNCHICDRKLTQSSQLPKHLAVMHGESHDDSGKKYKDKYPKYAKSQKISYCDKINNI